MRNFLITASLTFISNYSLATEALSQDHLTDKIIFRGRALSGNGMHEQTYTLEGELRTSGRSQVTITFDANPPTGLQSGVLKLPQSCDKYSTNYWYEKRDLGYRVAEFQICDRIALPKGTIFDFATDRINHLGFVVLIQNENRYIGSHAGFSDGDLAKWVDPIIPVDLNPDRRPKPVP